MPPIEKFLTPLKPSEALIPHPPDTDVFRASLQITLAWLAYFFGSITLQDLGVALAIIFTTLQIIVLLRDKFGFFPSKKEPK